MCDPCTLYYAAEPYCRDCIGAARRAASLQLGARVIAVVMLFASMSWLGLTGARAHIANARQLTTVLQTTSIRCVPQDRWLSAARNAAAQHRWHAVLELVARSERDCGPDADRYRLAALAHTALGNLFAAVANAVRYTDENPADPGAWQLRCEVLATFGQVSEARNACEHASDLDDVHSGRRVHLDNDAVFF
jgi:Flp pilus assembly protein TadD